MSDSTTPLKRCNKCQREFPATAQYWHAREASPDGLSYTCKECATARAHKWADENPDRVRENKSEYYQEHKEDFRAYKKEHEEHYREMKRSPKHKATAAARRKRKRKELVEYNRQYRDARPGWQARLMRDWRKRNPERDKATTHKRIAAMRKADGTYTADDIQLLYELQEGRCAYCGIPIYADIPKDVHVDHMHPLSRGGANSPDNLALSCQPCNQSKGSKTVAEWMEVRGW